MSTRVKRRSLAEAIIHPQRLELLAALEIHGPLTARQLQEQLPSLSQATLYRHLKTLGDAGIVVASKKGSGSKGAPEKAFSIAAAAPSSIRLRGREGSKDAMRRYLLAIQAAELAQFEKSAAAGRVDEDLFALRQSVVYLNGDELQEVCAMFARLKEFETRRAGRRRLFALNLRLFPLRWKPSPSTTP